jgi:hypothetical protein
MPTTGDFPLQLSLPLGSDPVDVSVLNANFEVINEHAGSVDSSITTITSSNWVTADRIAPNAVTANKIPDNSIPLGKLTPAFYVQVTAPTTTGWGSEKTGTVWISW